MITKLDLNNFRKHTSRIVEFTTGINVVRAVNEGGKTSLTESIAYALFGTKALRTSLDEAVTWGCDVKSLKVSVSLQSGGDQYEFSRSKAGAEILKNGDVFCTGQTEVSNFAAQLIGADAVTGAKLMLAGQNGIRGALEEGPKALSVLIEDLAGFSVFDRILDAASQKLSLGSSAILEERLKGAEATLEAATQNMPEAPDAATHEAQVKVMQAALSDAESAVPTLQSAAEKITAEHQAASEKYIKASELKQALETAKRNLADAQAEVLNLTPAASVQIDTSQLEVLRKQIADAQNHAKRVVAWRQFNNLPSGARFAGTSEQFELMALGLSDSRRAMEVDLRKLNDEISGLRRNRIDHDKCDKCGQDITHIDTVKETNARIDAALSELTPRVPVIEDKLKGVIGLEEGVSVIRRFAAKHATELKAVTQFVELDETKFPPVAKWVGEEPGDVAPEAPVAALTKLEADIKAVDSAKAKLELATEQESRHAEAVKKAEQALKDAPALSPQEFLEMTERKERAELEAAAAKGDVILKGKQLEDLVREYVMTAKVWESASGRIKDAEAVIKDCKADIASLGFNNALVKKLRAVRPMIAGKLWNTVLTSVSVMFSQMRGEPSVITKEASGFMCNGQAIESLSGSTLDILGVALRCALLRTFIPNCGLLVLDEPAQGCDTSRTEALLGFLQGFSMTQTLLITHEETSSAIADNIIQLD